MVEINNTFLLAGLVIVAVTCIYLLYVSFNKPDITSFKNTITNIVQQNKKRDEIVNFLLDKVQNLNKLISSLQQPSNNFQMSSSVNMSDNSPVVNEEVEVLSSLGQVEQEDVNNLMEHIDDALPSTTLQQEELTQNDLLKMEEMNNNKEVNPTNEVLQQSEFMVDGESEFESVMNIIQNNNIETVVEDTVVEDDVVEDTVVEDDVVEDTVVDSPTNKVSNKTVVDTVVDNVLNELDNLILSNEDLVYLRSLPQDKHQFSINYTGNDLRDICKRFKLGIYGRKDEMASRILKLLK